MSIKINILPKKIIRYFLFTILFLLICHCIYLSTVFNFGYSYRHFFHIFYLDDESNIPTFYSTVAIAVAAVLLFVIAFLNKKTGNSSHRYWIFLGILFTLIAYDEASSLHEYINEIFWEKYPDLPAYLGFGWVIPYFILVAAIGIFSISFLKSLPRKSAGLFIISGSVFVLGAMGMEFIGAYLWATKGGQADLLYNFFATIEELLEMLGITLFIYALLDYIQNVFGSSVSINFKKHELEKHLLNVKH